MSPTKKVDPANLYAKENRDRKKKAEKLRNMGLLTDTGSFRKSIRHTIAIRRDSASVAREEAFGVELGRKNKQTVPTIRAASQVNAIFLRTFI